MNDVIATGGFAAVPFVSVLSVFCDEFIHLRLFGFTETNRSISLSHKASTGQKPKSPKLLLPQLIWAFNP